MFRIHNDKIFFVGVMLLATAAMAIGQNIIDVVSAKADGEDTRMDLLPDSPEEAEESGEYEEALGFSLTPESAEEVTADGELSDFLVPPENAGAGDKTGQSFAIEGAPTILIYHTHTTEAYRQTDGYTYKQSGEFRTKEQDKNIVSVGEKLKSELEKRGFNVIHDTTDHEPPKLSTSYERSVVTMEKYLKEQNIDMFIDVHRDAASVEKNKDDVVNVDGVRCARMMFVVGKGTNYTVKPDFDSNYALASQITNKMEEKLPGIMREVRVKKGRYNQHLINKSLLVEVGHNANTLDEAQNSMAYLAEAIAAVVKG